MPPDSSRIFISYCRQDTPADAGRLADALELEFGPDTVFQDVSGIEIGANWERIVDQTLEDTVALILMVGPSWSLSDPIARELRSAIQSNIAIIPLLVRGAKWDTFAEALPSDLRTVEKLNARALDHGNWRTDIRPLLELLKRVLKDPTRARITCGPPPNSLEVLENSFNEDSVRSMLVHAADLAECLDDKSLLAKAKAIVKRSDSNQSRVQLIEFLGKARYRLLIEEIGRDLLSIDAIYAARYLQDTDLETWILTARAQFEEEKLLCSSTRGDAGDPGSYFREIQDLEAKARALLRQQLPGITKTAAVSERLSMLVHEAIKHTLSGNRIPDLLSYTLLKRFSRCPHLPYFIRDPAKAEMLLNSYESSLPKAL